MGCNASACFRDPFRTPVTLPQQKVINLERFQASTVLKHLPILSTFVLHTSYPASALIIPEGPHGRFPK